MSASARSPRRIVLLGGEHYHRSIGDIAMLQVAIDRTRSAFPDAELAVVTASPFRLGQCVSDVHPALITPGRRQRTAPVEYGLGRVTPSWFEPVAIRLRGAVTNAIEAVARRRSKDPDAESPADAGPADADDEQDDEPLVPADVEKVLRGHIDDADLLVVHGGGFMADADPYKAAVALQAMRFAGERTIPYLLASQGVGPLTEPRLLAAAREVLPHAAAIGTREESLSRVTLAGCGVAADTVRFTGDDALMLVERSVPPSSDPTTVGLSYRQAAYLGITRENAQAVHDGVAAWMGSRDIRWLPLVTSTYGDEDVLGVRAVVGDDPRYLPAPARTTPAELIGQVAGCSLVVSTTYHAALFGASTGVPTLAFGGTDYGLKKLEGIHNCFGDICGVVDIRRGTDANALAETLERIGRPANRARALEATAEYQNRVRDFYRDMPRLVAEAARP
jgi:polysaccharide pyruvyl transferase WcaK-like protein